MSNPNQDQQKPKPDQQQQQGGGQKPGQQQQDQGKPGQPGRKGPTAQPGRSRRSNQARRSPCEGGRRALLLLTYTSLARIFNDPQDTLPPGTPLRRSLSHTLCNQ